MEFVREKLPEARADVDRRPRRAVQPDSARSAVDSSMPLSPWRIASLQRVAGNAAVAQLVGSRPQTEQQPTVQRLAFNNTKWESATSAKLSAGGAGGVLFIDDGAGPLVVKSETFDVEAPIVAKLLTDVTKGASQGWTADAPDARPVSGIEAKRIHAKASELLQPTIASFGPDDPNKRRYDKMLDALAGGRGGTVTVYGFASGGGLEGQLKDKQTKRSGFLGLGRKMRQDSATAMMMNDPGFLTMIGRASAADIFLGNADRFVGKINFDNVLVDRARKHITLIDNIEIGDGMILRDMPQFKTLNVKAFKAWTQNDYRTSLAAGKFDYLADKTMEIIEEGFRQEGMLRPKDLEAVIKSFRKRRNDMKAWYKAGLMQATVAIRTGFLDKVLSLTSGLRGPVRVEVMTNLLARGYFLEGQSRDEAWKNGEDLAHLLAGTTKMPRLPEVPSREGRPALSMA